MDWPIVVFQSGVMQVVSIEFNYTGILCLSMHTILYAMAFDVSTDNYRERKTVLGLQQFMKCILFLKNIASYIYIYMQRPAR